MKRPAKKVGWEKMYRSAERSRQAIMAHAEGQSRHHNQKMENLRLEHTKEIAISNEHTQLLSIANNRIDKLLIILQNFSKRS